jgi:two-component system response regulator ResD
MTPAARVLVVEDDPVTADILCLYLDRAGYETMAEGDGNVGVARASAWRPDLVVLDVMLPGLNGLEVLRHLRDRGGPRVPVILLTARGEEAERIRGLRLGADDYVVKPFSPGELVARVAAVLRRWDDDEQPSPPLAFGGLEIHPAGRVVVVDGQEVALTQREFDLLLFLANHPGRAFTRDQLMDAVWRFGFYSDTTTVTVHIRRLRAKIEADPSRPRYIETVWGVGYRFRP